MCSHCYNLSVNQLIMVQLHNNTNQHILNPGGQSNLFNSLIFGRERESFRGSLASLHFLVKNRYIVVWLLKIKL